MRNALAILLFVLALTSYTFTQHKPQLAINLTEGRAVQRDAAALRALRQLLQTTGWADARFHTGLTASGALIHLDKQGQPVSSSPVSLAVRRDRRFKLASANGNSVVVSDAVASIGRGNSRRAPVVLAHVALSSFPPYFPFFTDIAAADDTRVTVAGPVTQTIAGEDAIGLILRRSFPTSEKFREPREMTSSMTLWVSQRTGLPLRLDFVRLAYDNWRVEIPYSLYFSNWTEVSGVRIPTRIDESSGGQVFTRLELSEVTFNDNIPDSEFDVADGGAN